MFELYLGGVASGKSERAEQATFEWFSRYRKSHYRESQEQASLAQADSMPEASLALAVFGREGTDADFDQRIARHRELRAQRLKEAGIPQEAVCVIECARDFSPLLRKTTQNTPALLVDDLSTAYSLLLMNEGDEAEKQQQAQAHMDELFKLLEARAARQELYTAVVSVELGLGMLAQSSAGRQFQDALGAFNQRLAALADTSYLVVAGKCLVLT